MYKKYLILSSFAFSFFIGSCSSDHGGIDNETIESNIVYKKVSLSDDVISTNSIGESITVCEAKLKNVAGNWLTVEGFIGGRREPISKERAIFIMGDHELVTCDEMPTDHCSTPWDACCEPREKISSSTLTVRLVDSKNEVLKGTLYGLRGIKPGQTIKVLGKVDQESIPESMIINAEKLELL